MTSPSQHFKNMIDRIEGDSLDRAKTSADKHIEELIDPDKGLQKPHLDDLIEILDAPIDTDSLDKMQSLVLDFFSAFLEATRRLRELRDQTTDPDKKDQHEERMKQWSHWVYLLIWLKMDMQNIKAARDMIDGLDEAAKVLEGHGL